MNYSPYNFGRLISLIDRKAKSFHASSLAHFNISVAEMPFFLTLTQKDGVSQEELTQWVGVDKALTTRAIHSLEQKGFVVRKRSIKDGRKQCVNLTSKAWEIADEVMDASNSLNDVLSFGISEEDMRTTYQVLIKMADNLKAPAESGFSQFDKEWAASKKNNASV